ncbi:MAG: tyrosine-type recombinase/integrase [Bacteroidales bacterium]|nr:tyrosine-type recombinase/integrase [Bacteroidales bacterium]
MENIRIEKTVHKGEDRLKIIFRYNREIIDYIQKFPGCRWSQTMHCWHLPVHADVEHLLKNAGSDKNTATPDIYLEHHKETNEGRSDAYIEIDEYNQLLFVKFPFNESIKNRIKELTGSWWHNGIKKWSVHYSNENIQKITEIYSKESVNFRIYIKETEKKRKNYQRKPITKALVPARFLNELRLQNKSENTIRHYEAAVAGFLNYFKNDVEDLSIDKIRQYILFYRNKLNYSPSFQNQVISALKLYYRIEHGTEIESNELPRPKKSRKLPRVISKQEVEELIRCNRNRKQRLVLMLMYGCGLRLGEVVNLRLEDIDFKRKQINICNGKGRKDRTINLTDKLRYQIEVYINEYAPSVYLFNGQDSLHYSRESIGNIVKNSAIKAGIKKRVTPHVLRHCYATHMLERGVDLRYIQYLMGHKSSKTTEIYTHVSSYKINELGSPIDDITI